MPGGRSWAAREVIPAEALPEIRRARYDIPRMQAIEARLRAGISFFDAVAAYNLPLLLAARSKGKETPRHA